MWTGAFSNLFGVGRLKPIPRVAILETFAECHDEDLTATDIIEMTGVSKRSVYLILEDLTKEGLIVKSKESTRPVRFKFNDNDVRARTLSLLEQLIVVGSIESQIKEDRGLNQWDIIEESILLNPDFTFSPRHKKRVPITPPTIPYSDEANPGWTDLKQPIPLREQDAIPIPFDNLLIGSSSDANIQQVI